MARRAGGLRTLADCAEWKCALNITCRRCRHGTVVYLPALIEKYGPTAELADLTPKFICSECGAATADVDPMIR